MEVNKGGEKKKGIDGKKKSKESKRKEPGKVYVPINEQHSARQHLKCQCQEERKRKEKEK